MATAKVMQSYLSVLSICDEIWIISYQELWSYKLGGLPIIAPSIKNENPGHKYRFHSHSCTHLHTRPVLLPAVRSLRPVRFLRVLWISLGLNWDRQWAYIVWEDDLLLSWANICKFIPLFGDYLVQFEVFRQVTCSWFVTVGQSKIQNGEDEQL